MEWTVQPLPPETISYGGNVEKEKALLRTIFATVSSKAEAREGAEALFRAYGNLYGIYRASSEDLAELPEVTPKQIELLFSTRELGDQSDPKPSPFSVCRLYNGTVARHICEYFRPYYASRDVERAYLLCLDATLHPLDCFNVANGDATSVKLKMEELEGRVKAVSASACILLHNHPCSGSYFSREDYITTERLFYHLLDQKVVLLDHLLLTGEKLYSLDQVGYFEMLRGKTVMAKKRAAIRHRRKPGAGEMENLISPYILHPELIKDLLRGKDTSRGFEP